MPRVLLVLPTATYRAPDFLAAAGRLGVDVVVASEEAQTVSPTVVIDLTDPDAAAETIAEAHRHEPVDAVLAVDESGVVVAARAAARIGLSHNPPEAVAATRDKAELRGRLGAAGLRQPRAVVVASPAEVAAAVGEVGLPCVVKPIGLAMSRGVIRADDVSAAEAAAERTAAIAGCWPVIVERFVPGVEVAVEGLLRAGALDVLAVFDKPDPLDGPYFEETIYVTPSRLGEATLRAVEREVARACEAIGLVEGPVHAELRVGTDATVTVLEVAARSIGGLCARTLRFGIGITLEEVILRHALGRRLDVRRERTAAGVLMLPIRERGVLERVDGVEAASGVPGIEAVEITVRPGSELVPLPEGDRYLGFVFARGEDPAGVEAALRRADACLEVVLR